MGAILSFTAMYNMTVGPSQDHIQWISGDP